MDGLDVMSEDTSGIGGDAVGFSTDTPDGVVNSGAFGSGDSSAINYDTPDFSFPAQGQSITSANGAPITGGTSGLFTSLGNLLRGVASPTVNRTRYPVSNAGFGGLFGSSSAVPGQPSAMSPMMMAMIGGAVLLLVIVAKD